MTPATPQTFSAAAIACALDKAPRSIRRALESVPHSSITVINGTEAKLWSLDALPKPLRDELDARARAQNCRDAFGLLNALAAAPWQPRLALSDVTDECRTKAVKLQRALLPSLGRMHRTDLRASEFETLALADYEREFGGRITARHWRDLLKRTLQRDGGREDWQRLEIYLADKLVPAPLRASLPTVTPATEKSFPTISAALDWIADKQNPTDSEIDLLWLRAIEAFDAERQTHARPGRLKREILESLRGHVPRIAGSLNAARVAFDTKFKKWLASPPDPKSKAAAVGDHRRRELRPAPAACATDVTNAEMLAWVAGNEFDGKLAPARREMVTMGILPPSNSRSKSYVEPQLRQLARQDAQIVAANKRGKRAIREMVPTLLRDPSKCLVNDAFTADDFTFPVLWYVPDGKGWFTLVEGQCLIVADWRSWRILQFLLKPDAQYNSRDIRTLFTKTFLAHNLPKKLILEGGIWRSSGLIKGNDARRKEVEDMGLPYSDGDVVYGLQSQLGIEIRHAISPTGKTQIESIGRIVQDLMWREKGYAGRDQRKDLPDETKRHKYEVDTRKAHPSKFFWSFTEWEQRLFEIFEQYNATPQQGIWLHNQSPEDAFKKYQNVDDPPIAFDARCAHLLANQLAERTITSRHEIVFEIGRQQYKYFSPQTVQLGAGARVLTWFDPAVPEFLVVTDLNRCNPITVPRSNPTDSLNPDDPDTQRELGRKGACASYIKTRFRTLAAKHKAIARVPVVAEATAELGAQIAQQRAAHDSEQKQMAKTRRLASNVNMALTPRALRREETPGALRQLNEFLKSEDDGAEAPDGSGAVKTYTLKSPPAVGPTLAQLRGQYWALWNRLQKKGSAVNRHALTQRTLGHVKAVKQFTDEELGKMISVFAAIIREHSGETA